MSKHTYTVVLIPEPDGGYVVEVPALPGCITEGDSLTEALLMVEEAMQLYLECLADEDEPIQTEPEELKVHMGDAREALLRKVTVRLGAPSSERMTAQCSAT